MFVSIVDISGEKTVACLREKVLQKSLENYINLNNEIGKEYTNTCIGNSRIIFEKKSCHVDEEHSKTEFFSCEFGSLSGEIKLYNHDDLDSKLSGISFPGKKNAASLVFHAYLKWGAEFVQHLNGEYSFVLWDKTNEVLWGVVDHFARKSLYFYEGKDDDFILSDRLEPLTHITEQRIDDNYALAYLCYSNLQGSKSPFHNINRVPGGSYLKATHGKCHVIRYWPHKDTGGMFRPSFQKQKDGGIESQLRTLIEKAVQNRVDSSAKAGILLSGGLDSSTVACFLAATPQLAGESLAAVSKVLPDSLEQSLSDERVFINSIAEYLRIPVNFCSEIAFTTTNLSHEYFQSQFDLPLNPFCFLTLPLYQRARSQGIFNLWSGFGGDEVVSCYGQNSLAVLLQQGRIFDCYNNSKAVADYYSVPLWKVLKSYAFYPLLPRSLLFLYRTLRGRAEIKRYRNRFIRREMVENTSVSLDLLEGHVYSTEKIIDPRHEIWKRIKIDYYRNFFQHHEYIQHKLGVNIIYPFLDKDVVEFMLRLDPAEFLRDGMFRSVMRRSLKGLIPEKIRLREDKKPINVGEPFCKCLVRSNAYIEEVLAKSTRAWDFIDRGNLHREYINLKGELRQNGSEEQNFLALEIARALQVACFYQWRGE